MPEGAGQHGRGKTVMTEWTPGRRTTELLGVLDELIPVLEWDGSHWARWMSKARSELIASNSFGLERLLNAYGGMGSFNDLVIGCRYSEAGELQQRSGYGEKNERLERLRNRAYELATAIQRDLS